MAHICRQKTSSDYSCHSIYIAQFGEKYNMRAVCISPGPVLTRANMSEMKSLLGRAAEPQEIVDLCLFVASDKGQFINGENIMIDGGRNAMRRPD